MANGNGKAWTEYFRAITPILLLTLNVLAGVLITNQNEIKFTVASLDSKVFHHLTNEELHILREQAVTQKEFNMYLKYTTDQYDKLYQAVCDLAEDKDVGKFKRR